MELIGKIRKDRPAPKAGRGRPRSPLTCALCKMDVGDSIDVDVVGDGYKERHQVSCIAHSYASRNGIRFSTRSNQIRPGVWRVIIWRTA